MKDRLRGKHSFQCHEGIVAGLVPGPRVSFLGKVKERMGGVRIVGNEASVEVRKTQEGLYVPDC